jgi:hypothetical protein
MFLNIESQIRCTALSVHFLIEQFVLKIVVLFIYYYHGYFIVTFLFLHFSVGPKTDFIE